MSSLKEIKSRIQSVKSTQKITSAMKMVSSAKLRKAERAITSMLPYEQKLSRIMSHFLSVQDEDIESDFSTVRQVNRVAVVVFSSNGSLCGSFNSNTIKRFRELRESYKSVKNDDFEIYTVGKKVTKAVQKIGMNPTAVYDHLADHPEIETIVKIADKLIDDFLSKRIDRVEFIYHQFKSKGKQVLTTDTLLPIKLSNMDAKPLKNIYIIEPDQNSIMNQLVPKVLRTTLYRALLDSSASEHAARMLAMQTATDNASELIEDLTLQYNKTRQQAITAELLDIVGGSLR